MGEKKEDIKETEDTKEKNDKMKSVKEFGNTVMSVPNERIQVLSIIGQIEGHMVSPPQTKTTKYEHLIPQLINIEQNENVKGILIAVSYTHLDVYKRQVYDEEGRFIGLGRQDKSSFKIEKLLI